LSLAEEANISKINYGQCTAYGGFDTCPDGSVGGQTFHLGQMYQGDVGAYNNQGEEIASMDNVSFVIMDKLQDWICDGPLGK